MKLAKVYEPSQYEPMIYGLWENSGAFRPSGVGEPYSIAIPPPNANGNLHVGHALMIPIEDILVRHYRMLGRNAVLIPGADHAGFETWVVYEKELEKQGKSRFDFTREQLYSQVWDFVENQRGSMELQLRALGASASWEHLSFSLDKKVVETVYSTFKRLWDDKLIYRGERIVNYCTKHQTGFADIEVEHKNEKSKLWQIAYPLTDKISEIIVATTRPETLLGDTAIAVHPDDARYKDLVGKHVLVPVIEREIPIIADEGVDPTFGTGAVKVTPAHDQLDFEIGERHSLERIQIIGFDGKMTAHAHQFAGLTPEDARTRLLAALQSAELLRGEVTHEHTVGHCYKCGTTIQPLLKEQWFLKMEPLLARAKNAISEGEITFTPKSRGKVLLDYLEGLRDWNLSRQIPWGIPIPAFQNTNDPNDWIFDDRVEEKTITIGGKTYAREEDTFDTWFSSGQWPFIVTDYQSGGELSKHYPLSVMETGHDILLPWVSRMIILGLYVTDTVPFKEVYLHGLVLDEHGQKMSKSKGNVVNPQELIDEYGSDALRMGIVSSRSAGQNQGFSRAKVVAGRNFANKLWNIARYIEDKLGDNRRPTTPDPITVADHWIVHTLNQANDDITKYLSEYRFAEATDTVYHVIWDSVADWYIESSKQAANPSMLAWVLETSLKLAHPFAPFVTETIWQTLAWEKSLLISSNWPAKADYNDIAAAEFEQLQALVTEVRYVSAQLASGKQTLLYEGDAMITDNAELIKHLAKLASVEQTANPEGLRLAIPNREAWLKVDEHTLKKHRKGLEKRLSETEAGIASLEKRLQNERYISQAPPELVEETKQQLKELTELKSRLQRELTVL